MCIICKQKYGGYLPLRIKAVPEGTVVPVKNVLFTVENTDPNVPWLTNWFEVGVSNTFYRFYVLLFVFIDGVATMLVSNDCVYAIARVIHTQHFQ
jgi:hypothetical protein